MKKKVHILLLIFLNVWGGINAQNIEFSNDILKKHLLSSSSENEIAKDINGNPMAIDANGDGEISLQEALNVYQLQVGMNNIYPTTYPSLGTPPETDSSSELTYFTNVRIFKYEGNTPHNCYKCFNRIVDATGFTNLEELYYLDGHYFYKAYPFSITLPKYLPNLKIVDAPIKISYSQAPYLEDLNCSYTVQTASDSYVQPQIFNKLNFSDFNNLKKITANADTIVLKNLSNLDSISLNSKFTHLENLPKIENLDFSTTTFSNVYSKELTIKNLIALKKLNCSHKKYKSSSTLTAGIKTLTLENLPELESIDCSYNYLSSLDLSQNIPNLKYLFAGNNLFDSTINLSKNTNIEQISLSNDYEIEHYDENGMYVSYNIKSLDVTLNKKLTSLDVTHNAISSLDLTSNKNLISLNARDNKLSSLDTSKNTFLSTIDLSLNTELDLINFENNFKLKKINLKKTQIKELDLTSNILLEELNIGGTQLSDINLSKNIWLKQLFCYGNFIKTLDLSSQKYISYLELNDSPYFELKNPTKLENLIIKNSVLDPWIISNSHYLINLQNMKYVCCDNDEEIENVKNSVFKNFTYLNDIIFDSNCNKNLNSEEVQAPVTVTLYPNPATDILYINTREKITKVEIFDTNGRLLISEKISSPKFTISTLPVGYYFITLHHAKGKINKQFIKN
ncbi:T9SS type A sorting domain-containing protein [Apibacter sp. HY039]|uniref:T9SS type A sorting domain-containing protein n=1 Tax=Apibacter sp. HY039 TaxID=2501476 RepID=UPI000FEBE944|nr:T9SS type A sorting domain-containing protein [Apibacter sp. HY039]